MKILYASDCSEDARAALACLMKLPLPPGSEVHLVSVLHHPMPLAGSYIDPVASSWEIFAEVRETETKLAKQAQEETVRQLQHDGVQVTARVREGDPAHEILTEADEFGADLVVVGSKGLTGLDSLLLGSVARNVAKHCRRPVLVARAPRLGLKRVVVATDGSEHAQHAARFAAALPLPEDAEITVVSVVRPYSPFPGLLPTDRTEFDEAVRQVNQEHHRHGAGLAGEAVEILRAAGKHATAEVREGDPATQIVELAGSLSADLVVAGARGVSLIQGLLVGSVAERLLKEAPCSVLLVH